MADINDLLVRIDATTESLRREMKRAEKTTDQTTGRMGRALRGLDRRFESMNRAASRARGAIGAVIGALAIRRVAQFARSQIEMADGIQKAADVAGISAEEIQELRFAFAQLAEVTDKQVDETLRRFNRRLGEARKGSAEYAKVMKQLGVNLRDDTTTALDSAIRGLAGIENAADRSSAAAKAFGDDVGPKVAAALSQGIDSFEDLRKVIREDGGIIGDDQIRKATQLNDQFDKMSRLLTAQFASTVLDNAEAIESLAIAMGKTVSVTTSGLSSVIEFTRWLGEEMAARIHGVAADDLPRLTMRLSEARAELERLQNLANDPIASLASGPQLDRDVEAQRAIVEQLERRVEAARNLNRVSKERETRPDPSTDEGPSGLPGAPKRKFFSERLLGIDDDFIDAFEDARDEADKFFDQTRTQTERLEAQIARVQELSARGFFAHAGIDDQEILSRLQDQLDELEGKTDEAASRMGEALANNVGGAIDEMFSSGTISARNFAESVLRDLARITVQLAVMKPLIESVFGGSSFGSGVLSAFGFAKGGEFTVGGSGGPDTQFVPLALSPGENVKITPPGQKKSEGIVQNINIPLAFPPQLEAFVRNVAGPAGRDAAIAVMSAQRGRL